MIMYLVTNIKGYNISNNNIIYRDLNPSTTSNNLLMHNLKCKVKNAEKKCLQNQKYNTNNN